MNRSEISRPPKWGIKSFAWWNETEELKVRKVSPMGIKEVFLLEDTVGAGILKELTHYRKVEWGEDCGRIFCPGITNCEGKSNKKGKRWNLNKSRVSFIPHYGTKTQVPRKLRISTVKYYIHNSGKNQNTTKYLPIFVTGTHSLFLETHNGAATWKIARPFPIKWRIHSPCDLVIALFGIYPMYHNLMSMLKTVRKCL